MVEHDGRGGLGVGEGRTLGFSPWAACSEPACFWIPLLGSESFLFFIFSFSSSSATRRARSFSFSSFPFAWEGGSRHTAGVHCSESLPSNRRPSTWDAGEAMAGEETHWHGGDEVKGEVPTARSSSKGAIVGVRRQRWLQTPLPFSPSFIVS